jgi:hypothetical protein
VFFVCEKILPFIEFEFYEIVVQFSLFQRKNKWVRDRGPAVLKNQSRSLKNKPSSQKIKEPYPTFIQNFWFFWNFFFALCCCCFEAQIKTFKSSFQVLFIYKGLC